MFGNGSRCSIFSAITQGLFEDINSSLDSFRMPSVIRLCSVVALQRVKVKPAMAMVAIASMVAA